MSLHLKYATSTATLVHDLVQSLRDSKADPAVKIPILLPSRPLVERVRVALARDMGIAMGVDFVLPAAFVESIANRLGMEDRHESWTPEGMFWRLMPLLEKMVAEGKFDRVSRACPDLASRISLAREVADRFDQYLHFRPQLIEAWDQGKAWEDLSEEVLADEAWQRELWMGLAAALKLHPHPAARWRELVTKIEAGEGELPESVEILATGPLPPLLRPVLKALGKRSEVHLRVLMPSIEYLGDIRGRRSQWRHEKELDRDWEANPLLAHLGDQAIQNFVVNELDFSDQGQEYSPLETDYPQPASLLAQIQSDIRGARQPQKNWTWDKTDRSLRAHRCHGARREVEVLRDELLDAFDNIKDLKAEEVLILAPDLETYGPLCRAILKGKTPSLPVKLAEIRMDQTDPIILALARLLECAAGRVPLSQVKGLLELEAVAAVFPKEGEREDLQRRLEASGFTFGINGAHRQALEAGKEETGTLSFALDRLSAGLWLGGETALEGPEGLELPAAGAMEGGSGGVKGLEWLSTILDTLVAWQTPAPPAGWAERLRQAMESLMNTRELDTPRAVDLIDTLENAAALHECDSEMDARAVGEWISRQALEDHRAVVTVGGAIALGGLKPLRALPCRVMAILGLQDGAFPRKTQAPAWDLLNGAYRLGDRNLLLEDRQLFLDALLSARERVILTASAKSLKDDKALPFSSCVDELVRVAEETAPGCVEDLVVEHKLQPFHAWYFEDGGLSYDEGALALAKAGFDPSREPLSFWNGERGKAREEHALDLESLVSRLKNPYRAWLRSLETRLPDDKEDDEAHDAEPVEALSGLERWSLRDAVARALEEGDRDWLAERLAANRVIPYGELGKKQAVEYLSEGRALLGAVESMVGGKMQSEEFRASSAGREIGGSLRVGPKGLGLYYFSDLKKSPKYRVDAWTRALFAAAAGVGQSWSLAWIDEKQQLETLELKAIPKEKAREWLDQLVDLAGEALGAPLAFMPKTSEAVHKALGNPQGRNPSRAARDAWDAEFGDGSDSHAAFAWRGLDPFGKKFMPAWEALAAKVYQPLDAWWEDKR